jgi:uncharacterized membrane protein YoaK (UPF0700 family)
VFVANMTGNIVFLGFAMGDARDFSVAASSTALMAFLAGAWTGGKFGRSYGTHRGHYLALALTINIFILGAATAAAVFPHAGDIRVHYILISLLAFAMGVQNSTARRLAVPDLTTTVLTMTLTGLAADLRSPGGNSHRPVIRFAAVAAMFAGAVLGATLVLRLSTAAVIALAFLIVSGVAITAWCFRHSTEPWVLSIRS